VVVHGEAGVGKTRLVQEVCDARPGTQVLWGTCVHFGEATVPFAAVAGALQSGLADLDAAERAEILAGAGELAGLMPALGADRRSEAGRLLPLIDLVVNRFAARAPTVVVIDDLQWADRTSLDVLAYLITGFREQRLALLATCRDEHRGEGHPLHGWLADLRRMPRFTELHLDRLDLEATEVQLGILRGGAVDVGFAAEVHERSRGNPYLTELLVRDLPAEKRALPTAAPAVLRDALLASWHDLSAATRQVTRVLAVGGRPAEVSVLADVVVRHGVDLALVPGCLTEAEDHGVVRMDSARRPWFRHPLLAEVLYDVVPPAEVARLHAAYAEALESSRQPEGSMAADLAVHNQRAGGLDASYRWSLTAADHAEGLHATAELADHLERACSLWDNVSPDVRGSRAEHLDLLQRTMQACRQAGRIDRAIGLAEQAMSLLDQVGEPLLSSTLLIAWSEMSWSRDAPEDAVVQAIVDADRLTRPFPDSPERASALAARASNEHWRSLHADAAAHAQEAVRVALRSGSVVAQAKALTAWACARHLQFPADALTDAEAAAKLARAAGSLDLVVEAAIWRRNCLTQLGRINEAATVALEAFEEVPVQSASQWSYLLASMAAEGLLALGRWPECRDLLRTALAARRQGPPGAALRLTAAQLAIRSGRLPEAGQHLDRALELCSAEFAGIRDMFAVAGSEVLVAAGKADEALDWISRLIPPSAEDARWEKELLVALAKAAAESAVRARDTGDTKAVRRTIASFEDVIRRWPGEPFAILRPNGEYQAMTKALFDAELARCRGDADQADRWHTAVRRCDAAGAPWEAAVSRWRCAEALLAAGAPRSAAGDLLRTAYRVAIELGAQPLRQEIESLARIARVPLEEPARSIVAHDNPNALVKLTSREREILAFLVAGRSNSEIAAELVISEKTVSVHVSNILRKTGTSNRVEAAALAGRLSGKDRRQVIQEAD
jgi:DNA-binding CsgD family transcriptional regulator/tetratricopeptide (TPR) repeat protein